jgi:hypothetical protein
MTVQKGQWERKQPQSTVDRGCRKAGDRTRTDDVQLGKLIQPSRNLLQIKPDTAAPISVVPKMVPSKSENELQSPQAHANRLIVVAELLVDLPETERQQIIAGLSATDRLSVVQMLVSQASRGVSNEQA